MRRTLGTLDGRGLSRTLRRHGRPGDGLTCEFPQKWISGDGLTLWSVFSVWVGAQAGHPTHDRFNLIKVTLTLGPGRP